jgi:pSer/pThr/pTyr-binding forkhead associated (FHA) protein
MEQFKYRCRGCRMQEQCIEASDTSQGAKEMIRRAFAARTDTVNTWAVLQKNCLLLKADEEYERRARERSTVLSRRLQEARTDQQQAETPPEAKPSADADQPSPILKPVFSKLIGQEDVERSTSAARQDEPTTASLRPAPNEALKTQVLDTPQPRTTQSFAVEPALSCWFIVNASQRRISLPFDGELILGRFDPSLNTPLDVDLAWEDQDTLTVSRRHARVVATNGHYTIRDLNSSNGIFINGLQVSAERAHPLQAGDRVALGQLEMVYDPIPPGYLESLLNRAAGLRHFLLVAHTGNQVFIKPPGTVTLGRMDRANNIFPTIDLGAEDELATYVSRRHASLIWNEARPYLTDLGSSYGTRLNGEALRPQQVVGLNPGDHISLGGCVLAYDIED